ncbi:tryptophan 2,3-dioxygenase [Streptomyces narbonensis]|uniref:tryptophan 2,3-dioxygenase n=1 Tax=Streptomyces narbonensis TaxID=67333 RepID=UPI001672DCD2|nr:tryptophan 2,3-dioxygenase family protein [Streptomyces narbonensis]GGW09999.1 tryptophan 2,3-dioxygenase [Streptomyces narbonensis]
MTSERTAPRSYTPLTEEERRQRAENTGGEPMLDFDVANGSESTAYIGYHHVDVLLALQHPRTSEPAELSFYITGQIQELLFKLLFTEVNRVRDLLFADDLDEALRYLQRVERVQRVLTTTWEPLSTMTTTEFAAFRDELGSASGIQSYMYRQLEFALGNKAPRLAEPYRPVAWAYEQVMAALRAPSLYDAALGVLRRRGLGVPAHCVERDFAAPYQPHAAVEQAWAQVYWSPREHRDLHALAEALSDLNHHYAQWRYTHLLIVERILGHKPGTGGTSGVSWLRKVAEHRFFPELLAARTAI